MTSEVISILFLRYYERNRKSGIHEFRIHVSGEFLFLCLYVYVY